MKIHHVFFTSMLFLASLMTAGCQGPGSVASTGSLSHQGKTVAPALDNSVYTENSSVEKGNKIALCQSELMSLKKVSPNTYLEKKAYFDRLIYNASSYISVRESVNAQTKDTLDALYKYKTNQVCAEIEVGVLQALIHRGESVK